MGIRTFIAFPLDEPIIRLLLKAQENLSQVGADVRWVERENLHLTLKFLGNVRDEELPGICAILDEAASQVEPFEFDISGLTSAPPMGQMRMIWAKIEEPTGRLKLLYEMLDEAFESLGYKKERRMFHPHLTVGRVKSGRNVQQLRSAVAAFADSEFGVQPAEEVVAYSSLLTRDGSVYTPLRAAPLGE
jgi:2'-5' RNA ligase